MYETGFYIYHFQLNPMQSSFTQIIRRNFMKYVFSNAKEKSTVFAKTQRFS